MFKETNKQTEDLSSSETTNLAKTFKEVPTHENRSYEKLKTIDEKWARDNRDTFICYACAEGISLLFTK